MSTLRVEPDTLEQLKFLKSHFETKSYDELMKKMIQLAKAKVSMFGSDPDLPSWEEVRNDIRKDRY